VAFDLYEYFFSATLWLALSVWLRSGERAATWHRVKCCAALAGLCFFGGTYGLIETRGAVNAGTIFAGFLFLGVAWRIRRRIPQPD
jgi:hypothetical protein